MDVRVAIDGPVASGKSTVTKAVAKKLALNYIDTGSMYRAVAWKAIKNGISLDDNNGLCKMIDQTMIMFKDGSILVDGHDISDEVRVDLISAGASKVAQFKGVRSRMVALQKELAQGTSVIMDGRDIGTVVMKDADIKIFMWASVDIRARRRYEDNIARGLSADLEMIKEEIRERDFNDINREESPLKQADDAVLLDSSEMNFDQTVEKVIEIIKGKN